MKSRAAWLVVAIALLADSAEAQTFKREELRIPAPGAEPRGLEALLLRPNLPGPWPLALITHGTPFNPADVRKRNSRELLPLATEFARRGWAALIVMRRGFGSSDGNYAEWNGRDCQHIDFLHPTIASAADLHAGLDHMRGRADIDASRVLAIGGSTGGLAALALASDKPSRLLAAINLAGGRMIESCPRVAVENKLLTTFAELGSRSRIPTLWIYNNNDKVFPPGLSQRLRDSYAASGGNVEFVLTPTIDADGHRLFSGSHMSIWMPHVDGFLKKNSLVWLSRPLPPH